MLLAKARGHPNEFHRSMGVPDSEVILRGGFEPLDLFAAQQ
ncbi:MAG: hypothetical protein V3V67_11090 [Myxococcota bacterium]